MRMQIGRRVKYLALFVTVLFFLVIAMESVAHARAGGGRSMGSRGFSSGGSFQRSAPTAPTRQPSQAQPGMAQPRPAQQAPGGFGRGMLYGLGGFFLGGMLGSMLFGGHSQAAGWGGTGGFGMGDLIIILVILGIIFFIYKRYRRRQEMQMGTAGAAYAPPGYDAAPAYGGDYGQQDGSPAGDNLTRGLRYIRDMDPGFDENRFRENAEDMFFRIQSAWTKRDLTPVLNLLSPEMLNGFQKDVNDYIGGKRINRLENIAVRHVDLVDAGQDHGEEYITVRLTASLLDYVVDETTSNVISGSASDPVKFLEYWTFSRKIGGGQWVLSGITQEGDY